MPKQHKIKRSKGHKLSYRAKPHPLSVILTVALIGALLFLGISLYRPVTDYFANRADRPEVSLPDLEDPQPEPGEEGPPAENDQPAAPDPVEGLRTVYLPPATLLSNSATNSFLDSLSGTVVNAVMVDIKNQDGEILFNSQNQSAAQWGTLSETPFDLDALVSALESRNLHLVVRMSAFKDEPAARVEVNDSYPNGILYAGQSYHWLDNYRDQGGRPWLNPSAPGTQRYLTDLAAEAVDRGAVMVVLMDFQFPDGADPAYVDLQGYDAGRGRDQILREYAQELAATLEERGARLALYYPAATFAQSTTNQYRFGGGPEALLGDGVELMLGALPYQFAAGYNSEGLELEQPLANPSATVGAALGYVQAKLGADTAVTVLLQGGAEPGVEQTLSAQTVMQQVQTAADLGVQEVLLYCTDSGAYLIQ